MRPVVRAVCGGLALVLATRAAAQTIGPDTVPGGCRVEITAIDTLQDTVFAWLPALQPRQNQAEHDFWITQAGIVLGVLQPIGALGTPDAPWPPYNALPRGIEASLDAAIVLVWFQVRNDGRLAGMRVERHSRWNALDLGIQRAILRADSLQALQPLPAPLVGRPVDIWMAAGFERRPDGENVAISSLRHVELRYRGGRTPPRFLRMGYRPVWPVADHMGISDSVLMEFVVDTTGFVRPETVRPVHGAFREFAEEAVRGARSAQYEPARVGGCKVAMRARLAIRFDPRR